MKSSKLRALRSEEHPSIKLPPALRQRAAALLDQQMWCWGCDVRHPAGNLLLAYGAEKRPAPELRLHSAYSFQLGTDTALNLWGWGIWIACQSCGSVFVSRAKFRVRYTGQANQTPQAWCECDLPPTRTAVTSGELYAVGNLLSEMCRWISAYESWLLTQVDCDYREQAIAAWPERKRHSGGVRAAEMAASWIVLSEMLHKELSNAQQTQNHPEETDVRQQPSLLTEGYPAQIWSQPTGETHFRT